MKLVENHPPQFSIKSNESVIWVYRDNQLELVLKTKSPKLLRARIEKLLPQDYYEYLQTYNLESASLEDWFKNVAKLDTGVRFLLRNEEKFR